MLADVFQVPTYYIQYIHTVIHTFILHKYTCIHAYTEHPMDYLFGLFIDVTLTRPADRGNVVRATELLLSILAVLSTDTGTRH